MIFPLAHALPASTTAIFSIHTPYYFIPLTVLAVYTSHIQGQALTMSSWSLLPTELKNHILSSLISITLATHLPLVMGDWTCDKRRIARMWSSVHNLLLTDPELRHEALSTARILLAERQDEHDHMSAMSLNAAGAEAVKSKAIEVDLLYSLIREMVDNEPILEFVSVCQRESAK